MRRFVLTLFAVGFLALTAASAPAAVTLEQDWHAGQQLVYDTQLNGMLHLQLPAAVPLMIAGMPLEISLRGVGKTTMNTLKVNDFGDGTVQIKMNPLSIEAQSYGQRALIKVNDGKANMTINGTPRNDDFLDWNLLANPPVQLTFSPQMKVTDITFVGKSQPVAGNMAPAPSSIVAMIQNLVLQSLPAMLPNKRLHKGDQWTSDVKFKTSPAPGAAAVKLGTFQFQLVGTEKLDGRTLQHITLSGDLNLTPEQSSSLAAGFGAPKMAASSIKNAQKFAEVLSKHLIGFNQTIDGDLYFDAKAGRFEQADLQLEVKSHSLPKTGKTSTPDGFMNFTGALHFDLEQVIDAKL